MTSIRRQIAGIEPHGLQPVTEPRPNCLCHVHRCPDCAMHVVRIQQEGVPFEALRDARECLALALKHLHEGMRNRTRRAQAEPLCPGEKRCAGAAPNCSGARDDQRCLRPPESELGHGPSPRRLHDPRRLRR
jgi:hypothetical protein